MPEISVIMPIYNTNEVYLRQAIESILKQSFHDFEFLILNDSPQNTQLDAIVNSYIDSRLHYFKNDMNLGIAQSHNILLQKSSGKFIAMMDHDDISLPNRLEKQVTFMKEHPDVGICGSAYYRFGKAGKTKIISHPEQDNDIKSLLFFKCPILHPSCMLNRSVLKNNNISYDTRFISVNDRQLFLDISKHAKLHNLPEVLYKYRYHENMTSRVRKKDIKDEQLTFRKKFCEQLGLYLSQQEEHILNAYLLTGRCRIKDINTLIQIEKILNKLLNANAKTGFADTIAFNNICATYLIKRCVNAYIFGRVSSFELLKNTTIPLQSVNTPLSLKIFNFLKRRNS